MLQFGLAAAFEVLHAAIGGEAGWIPEVGRVGDVQAVPLPPLSETTNPCHQKQRKNVDVHSSL